MTLKLRFGYRSLQLPLDLEIFVLYIIFFFCVLSTSSTNWEPENMSKTRKWCVEE